MILHDPPIWPSDAPPDAEYCGEDERLLVLASFDLDGLDGDPELARIARFAARLCGAPSAMVSLVEAERQRFLASVGTSASDTPRSTSICASAMLGQGILEICDTREDNRFCDFDLVKGAEGMRYYAGAPLVSSEGAPLGALCINDTKPRTNPLDEMQREGLIVLAEAVKRRLESYREANAAQVAMRENSDRVQFVLDSLPDIAWSASAGPKFDYFNARFTTLTGFSPRQTIEDWRDVIHPDDFEATASKFSHALENALPFEDEWRLRMADGSYRYILSRAIPSSNDPKTARWFGTLTDIDAAHRLSQKRELLAGELAHRIKNIFSVIVGLVSMHARGDATLAAFGEMLSDNIRALARAQEFALQIGEPDKDSLHDLLGVLMAPYGLPEVDAVRITGDDIRIGRRAVTPLALVFHEFATNSAKYGALSASNGQVDIVIKQTSDDIVIEWSEAGGPQIVPPKAEGFGSRLVTMSIENQLGGTIEQSWPAAGMHARIAIPLDSLAG